MKKLLSVAVPYPGKKVTAWDEIEEAAKALRETFDAVKKEKGAFALHNLQVDNGSDFNFFVIDSDGMVDKTDEYPFFCNLKILEKSGNRFQNLERSLSMPHRAPKKVLRYEKIKAEYLKPMLNPNTLQGVILRKETQVMEGPIAALFQHYAEIGQGRSIYSK